MDDFIHKRLELDALKWIVDEPDMETSLLKSSLAGLVLLNYIEINALDYDGPAFFEGGADRDAGFTARAGARVQSVANLLLEFRNSKSFDELCNRMKGRELRSSYFEGEAAYLFLSAGFDIYTKPETGVKGADFDFSATRGDVSINGEVTALNSLIYSPKTLESALKKKRAQLPSDKPAVIFCAVPMTWYTYADLHFSLAKQTFEFFRGSKRINAVVFLFENSIDLGQNGEAAYSKTLYPIVNQTARHQTDLSFLYDWEPAVFRRVDRRGAMRFEHTWKLTAFERWFQEMVEKAKILPVGWKERASKLYGF